MRSSTRRAFWAFTLLMSIVPGCATASLMARGVISLKVMRRISAAETPLPRAFLRWKEIASPSRSLSEASRMRSDFFAFCFRSLRIFALPRTVMYSGSKVPDSTSMARRDFGRSIRWPIEAATV